MIQDLFPAPMPQLALLAVTSSLSPGANSLLIAASSASFGVRRSLVTLAGMYAGFSLMFVIAGFGVSTLFEAAPWLLVGMRWAGAAYVLYLAVGLLRAKWAPGSSSAPMGFGKAALLQLLYPKLWLMAIATISLCSGQNPDGSVSLSMVLFFVVMTLPGMLLYLRLGGVLRSLSSAPRTSALASRSLAALTALSAVMLLVPA